MMMLYLYSSPEREIPVLLDVRHKAAVVEDCPHDARQGRECQREILRQVRDRTRHEIDFEPVAGFDARGVALDDRQAHVDGVAEKDAGEGFRQHRRNTGELDDGRRVFAGGAEAEVRPAHDEVAGGDLRREFRVGVLEHVLRELGQVRPQVEQPPGGDEVGRNVVAERPCFARKRHRYSPCIDVVFQYHV